MAREIEEKACEGCGKYEAEYCPDCMDGARKDEDKRWKEWLTNEAVRHNGSALGDAIDKTTEHIFMHKNLFT